MVTLLLMTSGTVAVQVGRVSAETWVPADEVTVSVTAMSVPQTKAAVVARENGVRPNASVARAMFG